ncbi:MAG: hypothetical protein JWM74_3728, partial [Myxococcaceae bacterium]|nr:hypothetical protein [Myxococcaceae bacterium]
AALDRLHAILTPLQRGALVDALEDEHAGGGAHRGRGPGNARNERDGNARGKAQHHAHDRAARWADELALTDAQKDQIKDAMRADRGKGKQGEHGAREARQHLGHTMQAFREDRFVAAEAAGTGANQTKAAHEPSERTIHFMEIAVPVLTPAQRTLAAQKLRERADKKD